MEPMAGMNTKWSLYPPWDDVGNVIQQDVYKRCFLEENKKNYLKDGGSRT